jgi:hypothetical protein
MPLPGRRLLASSPEDEFVPLRTRAALARSLLDELDRALPMDGTTQRHAVSIALREQLAEELGRMGCQLLECAASLTHEHVRRAAAGQA